MKEKGNAMMIRALKEKHIDGRERGGEGMIDMKVKDEMKEERWKEKQKKREMR